MAGATERLAHVAELLPEICTLDCGTMNFGEGDYVMTNTPAMLKAMAGRITALGVRPEIEIFDTGHLVLAKWLVEQGLIETPVLVQLCMGIPWGAPDDIATLTALVGNLPEGWIFSAFSIGRNQLPYAALAVLAGGNVRVGLEDNLWLGKGQLATNGALVERAATIVSNMGARVLSPDEVREKLKLAKRGSNGAEVRRAAIVGGGVIGGGWVARLVQNGIDVAVYDPDPEAERKIGEVVALADRAFAKLTNAPRTRRGALPPCRQRRGGGRAASTSSRRARRSGSS